MKARWTWWIGLAVAAFLGAPRASIAAGQTRTVEIAVTTNGFEPARVKVAKGEPLKLVVTRKTDETCAKQIVIPDENIKAELPLNKPVTLSFTPKRAGEIKYACVMDMITGVLEVASSDAPGSRGMSGMQGMNDAHASQGMQGMNGMGGMQDQDDMHHMSCGCMRRGAP
jgi:plastocyanin domain-containing protein